MLCDCPIPAEIHENPNSQLSSAPPFRELHSSAADICSSIYNERAVPSNLTSEIRGTLEQALSCQGTRCSHPSHFTHVKCAHYSSLQVSTPLYTVGTCHALRLAHMETSLSIRPAPILKTLEFKCFGEKLNLVSPIISVATCTAAQVVYTSSKTLHLSPAAAGTLARRAGFCAHYNCPPLLFQPTEKES